MPRLRHTPLQAVTSEPCDFPTRQGSRGRSRRFAGAFHFTELLFKPLNLGLSIGGNTVCNAVVNVGLSDPKTHRLNPISQVAGPTAQLFPDQTRVSPSRSLPTDPQQLSQQPTAAGHFFIFAHVSRLVSKTWNFQETEDGPQWSSQLILGLTSCG